LPADAIPVDIQVVTEKHIITGRTATLLQESKLTDATTFLAKIKIDQQDSLLHNVELQLDEQRIRQSIQRPAQFDTASDGGHDQITGILTYGWVISINEIIIATGYGPAEAHPHLAESYRAEAYGLASATAFIRNLVQHFGINVTDHRWFFLLDSKTLIRRMESYRNETITPKWAHKPDADITTVAHNNIRDMNAQFIHIKGHQDKGISDKPLKFTAAMNIKADGLAAQQRQLMTKPKINVTTKHKHIKIEEMYVTRDSQQWILDVAGKIPIRQYFHEKYGWTHATFEEIDWDLQLKVLSSYDINDQRRILKFVHGWLPTNYRLHREQQQPKSRCPLCFYLEEQEIHLFQCRHPLQQEKVIEMTRAIKNVKNINPELLHIIAESFQESIKEPGWEPQPTQSKMFPFVKQQTTIGWQHLLFGRISKTLANNIALDDKENKTNNPATKGKTRYIIKTIWDTFLALCQQRNEIVHENQTTTKTERQRQALQLRVQRCYDFKSQLRHTDQQKLFKLEHTEMMQEDPQKIKAWTRVAERIIKTSKREQEQTTNQQGKFMEQYFKWHPPEKSIKRPHSRQRHKQDLHPD
jgi:hypothetical protein